MEYNIVLNQCKKVSDPVEGDIKVEDIESIANLCKKPFGKKTGAFAIAHCQVNHSNPLRYFVTAGGDCIINPKVLEKSEPFMHLEGCMSYAFRPDKKVKRFNKIKVEYFKNNIPKKIIEEVEGLKACIFQHEIDHFNGKAIY